MNGIELYDVASFIVVLTGCLIAGYGGWVGIQRDNPGLFGCALLFGGILAGVGLLALHN